MIKGWANESLLDSYHDERQPIATINSKQSVKNGQRIFRLLREFSAEASDYAVARTIMAQNLSDSATRRRVAEAVEHQREHFDNLNLHIGYQYGVNWSPRSCSDYSATFEVGTRLPHAWIDIVSDSFLAGSAHLPPPPDLSYFNSPELKGRNSTLDLVEPLAFSIIIGQTARLSNLKWEIGRLRIPCRVVVLGHDFVGVTDDWLVAAGLSQGGGLIVRPDQHILHRILFNERPSDLISVIRAAVGII